MSGLEGSVVQLLVNDDVDIAQRAVISDATFDSAAMATPGTCEVGLRDVLRDFSITTGDRLRLIVDDVPLWAGYALIIGRTSFFPAGDGREDTRARKFLLKGVDNNILFDKRILHNPDDHLHHIPHVTTNRFDGSILRQALDDYTDSWPFSDSGIDDVQVPTGTDITTAEPWAWPEQGSRTRDLFEDLARWSGAVYYVGPDDVTNFHGLQTVESPWGFSDRPNHAPIIGGGGFEGAYWGFRELYADEDGTQFGTDAFVWGGSPFAGSGGTVFARATDEDLEAIHGKWQIPEAHFNETNFKTQKGVNQRANMIVFGNPTGDPSGSEPGSVVGEGPRGLRFPQWSYGFTWHQKDVPSIGGLAQHLRPGDIVPIQLWAFSEDEGVTPFNKFLPLRSLRISFPSGAKDGKAHVRFGGTFDLRNEDSKFLWKYLRKRAPIINNIVIAAVTDDSDTAQQGAFGQFIPTPAPDGVNTVFNVKFGYIPGTTRLYLGGTLQRLGIDYLESDPDTGEITTLFVPAPTDTLFLTCRTQGG